MGKVCGCQWGGILRGRSVKESCSDDTGMKKGGNTCQNPGIDNTIKMNGDRVPGRNGSTECGYTPLPGSGDYIL
jgi:hypothetical protein